VTLKSLGNLIHKYELAEGGKVTSHQFALPDRFWRFAAPQPGDAIEERSKKIRKTNKVKKILWAAGDAQLARALIDDLRKFNEDLRAASGDMRRATFSTLPSRVLPQFFDDDNLKRLIEASAEQEPDLSRCAAIKKEVLEVVKASQGPPDPLSPMRKSMATIKDEEADSQKSRRIATYVLQAGDHQTVILEDKFYASNNEEEFTEKRVQEIAQILGTTPKPEKLRILDCLGYTPIRQKQCFAFIYSFPPGVNTIQAPISLADLLPSGSHSLQKPSLGTRFAMSCSLASSLLLLQACGVLHKALKAENIVFFKFSGATDYDLTRPYIVGFDFARLLPSRFASDRSEILKDGLTYAHPSYDFTRKQRYVEIFDIYSLGLLLVQVALWKDLSVILQDIANSLGRELHERADLQSIIVEEIRQLESEVGEIFTRAAARCLSCDLANVGLATMFDINTFSLGKLLTELEKDISEAHEEVRRNLEKNVVLELEKCTA